MIAAVAEVMVYMFFRVKCKLENSKTQPLTKFNLVAVFYEQRLRRRKQTLDFYKTRYALNKFLTASPFLVNLAVSKEMLIDVLTHVSK